MSLNQLVVKIQAAVPRELLNRFENQVFEMAKGKSCSYCKFFDRLNAPIKDSMGNELTEFTVLNKTSVIGESRVSCNVIDE